MSRRWRSNPLGVALELSALLTVLAGIAVLLRIAGVARGRLDFAFALVSASDFSQILLSTLLVMAPALSFASVVMVEAFAIPRIYSAITGRGRPDLRQLAWLTASIPVAYVVSSVFQTKAGGAALVIVAVVFPAIVILFMIFRPKLAKMMTSTVASEESLKSTADKIGLLGFSLAILGALILFAYALPSLLAPTDEVWAPTEVLYFDDREPYIGRILSHDEQWTHVVIDDPREIRIVSSDHLTGREICTLDSDVEASEANLWLANLSHRVYLRVNTCEVVLEDFAEFYADNS